MVSKVLVVAAPAAKSAGPGRDLLVSSGDRDGGSRIAPPEKMNAEDPLFILYTSALPASEGRAAHDRRLSRYASIHINTCSTTGRRHLLVHGRCRLGSPANSYIVYGPLANAATTLMFEACRTSPTRGRFWKWSTSTRSTSSTPRRPRSAR
ncbi:hypothetical protein F2981_05765 [Sinorhizobium meliloti]|nr:hypothetical protein [Sinorhizobium meliloti]